MRLTHTLRAEGRTLMVGDLYVTEGHREVPIDELKRADGVTTVYLDWGGPTKEVPDGEYLLIKLPELGKLPPRQLAGRVLGRAVHPFAVNRLFEIWPEAQVEVSYHESRRDGVETRVTRVEVWEGEKNVKPASWGDVNHRHITREARCLPGDQFNRRDGIRIAFDRCLREAVRRSG